MLLHSRTELQSAHIALMSHPLLIARMHGRRPRTLLCESPRNGILYARLYPRLPRLLVLALQVEDLIGVLEDALLDALGDARRVPHGARLELVALLEEVALRVLLARLGLLHRLLSLLQRGVARPAALLRNAARAAAVGAGSGPAASAVVVSSSSAEFSSSTYSAG